MTGLLLDFAVQTNMVLGQRAIYSLDPESRGRLNAIYMTSIFVGGAIGSALTSLIYAHLGWNGIMAIGGALPLVALAWLLVSRSGSQDEASPTTD